MKRESYIDIVKGISILSIVLLHYVKGFFSVHLCTFVGSYMITAFYVISGWVIALKPNRMNMHDYLVKRFHQLGMPYLYWTAILLAVDVIFCMVGYYDSFIILRDVYKSIILRGIGTLWFLPSIFVGGVLWHYTMLKGKIYIIIAFIIFWLAKYYESDFITFIGIGNSNMNKLFLAPVTVISCIINAWFCIALGYFVCKFSSRFQINCITNFTIGVIFLMISYLLTVYYPQTLSFKWGLFTTYLFGPLGLIYLSLSLQYFKPLSYLVYWGRNSLNIMVTHYSITLVLMQLIVERLLDKPFIGWITLWAFFVSLPIQHFFVWGINKYAKPLLGK